MPKQLRPLIALAWLGGCATAGSSPAAPDPCRTITVPSYTRDVQARVADEMDAAPVDAAWPDFVRDYGRMRAAVRACRGAP